jgi:hypothetical protein
MSEEQLSVEVEIVCNKCGNDLSILSATGNRLSVEVCNACMADAETEGYDEGYDAATADIKSGEPPRGGKD